MFDIAKHFENNRVSSDKKRHNFVSPEAFSVFFENLTPQAVDKFPFDMSENGYKTTYFEAAKSSVQADFVEQMNIVAEFSNSSDAYLLKSAISFEGDQLFVHIDSLCRTKGDSHNNFADSLLKKMHSFIKAQDESRQGAAHCPSQISVYAYSDSAGTSGGYVWAKHNFCFENDEEKTATFLNFKKFCHRRNINPPHQKFNQPCDYAAVKQTITDENGNDVPLGKAFLLSSSWRGQITSQMPLDKQKSAPFLKRIFATASR